MFADNNQTEIINEISWVTSTKGVRLPRSRDLGRLKRYMIQWEDTTMPGVSFDTFRNRIKAFCGDEMVEDSIGGSISILSAATSECLTSLKAS